MGTKQICNSDQVIYPFYYKLVDNVKIEIRDNYINQLSFNYDSSKLLVHSGSKVLKGIAILKMPKYISSLRCTNNSNNFMITSFDKFMAFLSIISLKNGKLLNIMKINDEAACLLFNNAEDQIFIGGYRNIIIFNKLNGWKIHQQIQIGNFYITDLCINQSDKYLACRSGEMFSSIFEVKVQGIQTIWIQKQQIKVSRQQWRQIFVNDNTFIIKQFDQNLLFVYKISNSQNLFLKTQEINLIGQSKNYPISQMQFNKQLQILAINNDNNINIIAIINNEIFENYQTINCKQKAGSGSFSLDGTYFAIIIQHKTNISLFKLIIR